MLNGKQKEVNPEKFAYVEARDNGFVWFSEKTGDIMLECKAKDKLELSDIR